MTIYCGVDFHTRQQLIKWCDTLDGEIKEQRLFHDSLADVRNFYSQFTGQVRSGIEACGYSEWFERMMHDLGHEIWVGDATKIRRRARSRQKTDRRDAELLIDLGNYLLDAEWMVYRSPPSRIVEELSARQLISASSR